MDHNDDETATTATQCVYWDELEFMAADQAFDAGEWSAAAQDEDGMPHNQPCGTCPACLDTADFGEIEEANQAADLARAPDRNDVPTTPTATEEQ